MDGFPSLTGFDGFPKSQYMYKCGEILRTRHEKSCDLMIQDRGNHFVDCGNFMEKSLFYACLS